MNDTTSNTTNLHMSADVWNALVGMLNVSQLENFTENLDYIQDKLVSDQVITNCIDDFGGPNRVLLLLNAFKRMSSLFSTISIALKEKGGVI